MTSVCSGEFGCGAEIVWAVVDASGKRIPLDPLPIDNGNIAYLSSDTDHVEYVMPGGGLFEERMLFVSHFATCPNADQFRKRKR